MNEDLKVRISLIGAQAFLSNLNGLQSSLRRVGAAISAISAPIISAGVFFKLAKDAIDAADEMGRLAEKTGIAVEELSGLAFSAKLADVSQEQLQAGIKKLTTDMAAQGRGAESVSAELLKIADQFERLPDGASQSALAVRKFGRAGLEMIPFLNQGSAAIRKQIEEVEALGGTISEKFAKNADQFNDSIDRIALAGKGFFNALADTVLPTLNRQIEDFIQLLTKMHIPLIAFGVGLAVVDKLNELETKIRFFKNIAAENGNVVKAADRTNAEMAAADQRTADAQAELTKQRTLQATQQEFDVELKSIDLSIRASQIEMERLRVKLGIGSLNSETVKKLREELTIQEQLITNDKLKLIQKGLSSGAISGQQARDQNLSDNSALARIGSQRNQLTDPSSLTEQMARTFETLKTQIGTVAQQIARAFTSVVGGAIDGIANGIQGLINGTMTWGEALRNVGSTILNSVVQAISKMFAEWIVGRALVAAKEIFFSGAEAAAKAPGALLTSISSYGGAAVAGLAAFGVAIAALAGAFQSGGYTGDGGVSDPAGIVHKREFVFDAPTVDRIGVANLEAMRSGGDISSGGGTNVAFFDDRSNMEAWLRSRRGQGVIIDIVGGKKYLFQG